MSVVRAKRSDDNGTSGNILEWDYYVRMCFVVVANTDHVSSYCECF